MLVGKLYTAGRRAARCRLLDLLYGDQYRCLIAPIITGWLAQGEAFKRILASAGIRPETSWHWGFGAAAVGMFLGLVQYMLGGKHLSPDGLHPVRPSDPAAAAKVDRQVRLVGLVTRRRRAGWRGAGAHRAGGVRPRGDLPELQVGSDRRHGGVLRLAVSQQRVDPGGAKESWW